MAAVTPATTGNVPNRRNVARVGPSSDRRGRRPCQVPAGPAKVENVDELTIEYEIRGRTTVVALRGNLDPAPTRRLRDAVEAARMLRPEGPIVVDLAAVNRIPPDAAVALLREAKETEHSPRPMTVRGL